MISESEIRRSMGSVASAALKKAQGALQVVQRQQWQRAFNDGGQPSERWPDLWASNATFKDGVTHYRAGGQPLRDTGELAASGYVKESYVDGRTVVSTWASTVPHAAWHQEGFHTNGPNFIPLTLHARRTHRKGVNPSEEGLEKGVDYIMAWAGVHVPARPMIAYDDPVNRQEINDTVAEAIRN